MAIARYTHAGRVDEYVQIQCIFNRKKMQTHVCIEPFSLHI